MLKDLGVDIILNMALRFGARRGLMLSGHPKAENEKTAARARPGRGKLAALQMELFLVGIIPE
jgi:hypothetical protein